jgi:hypothetical protein
MMMAMTQRNQLDGLPHGRSSLIKDILIQHFNSYFHLEIFNYFPTYILFH